MIMKLYKKFFRFCSNLPETSKVMRFWSICKFSHGNYLELKDKLFAGETVDSLSEKIKAFQDEKLANEEVNNG